MGISNTEAGTAANVKKKALGKGKMLDQSQSSPDDDDKFEEDDFDDDEY